MTPISAIASLPLSGPDQEPNSERAARRVAPGPDVAPAVSDASPVERSFWDRLWGKEGFSFGAVLDIINPLQHIPIVSTIYRAATGDTIGAGPRMIGGTLFGGVVGLFAATADAAVEGITGKDTGSHVLAMLPDPVPVAQWGYGDEPRQRGLMTAVMNLPNGSPSQFAATAVVEKPAVKHSVADTAIEIEKPPQLVSTASSETAASLVGEPAAEQRTNRLFSPKPRSAQLGAGGQLVPLAVNGRPGANLPAAKDLAANPALLQEMRQGGASAINGAPKNTGRIDTAIKGRGFMTPATASEQARNQPNGAAVWNDRGAAAWHDRMARESQNVVPAGDAPPKTNAAAIPEVSPDFFLKMQQALDKYQALRPAPAVDVSH